MKKAETIWVVRGIIPYECQDLLSGWLTEAGALAEVDRLEAAAAEAQKGDMTEVDSELTYACYIADSLDVFHQAENHVDLLTGETLPPMSPEVEHG